MVSGSRKQANQHDPEEKKDFWVKEAGKPAWPGGEKRFLGQGSRQASMTRRKEMISGSRKQASQHDPEEKKDF